jgi:hypothetical protein
MEVSRPSEAKSCSHDYQLSKILLKPEVGYHIQNDLTWIPILSQMNPAYSFFLYNTF